MTTDYKIEHCSIMKKSKNGQDKMHIKNLEVGNTYSVFTLYRNRNRHVVPNVDFGVSFLRFSLVCTVSCLGKWWVPKMSEVRLVSDDTRILFDGGRQLWMERVS